MAKGVLAMTVDGKLTYCNAPAGKRGMGRCNHVAHKNEGESDESFFARGLAIVEGNEPEPVEDEVVELNNISPEEIDSYKKRMFEILGTDQVTPDNIRDLINNLPPEKQNELTQLGFEVAPYFGFEADIDREEVDYESAPKIKLSNMGEYGIGAKKQHIAHIMDEIGSYVSRDGDVQIEGNYVEGLTEDQYWEMAWATRRASVNKTVSIAVPGYAARKAYYAMSDFYMMSEDCANDESTGILTCSAPGGCCERCANKSGMGKILSQLKSEQRDGKVDGIKIGGLVSSNSTEPLTQLYLDAIHSASSDNTHQNIINTFDCYSSSPIIRGVSAAQTTAERRRILSDGLKKLYRENGVEIDDYNIEIIAKKMTSYKRTPQGLKLIDEEKGELCDIVSLNSIGASTTGNVFKKAAIGKSFMTLAQGGDTIINPNDSFEDIFRDIKH